MNFYFFRILSGLFLLFPGLPAPADDGRILLNDLHSRLNPTEVQAVFYPAATVGAVIVNSQWTSLFLFNSFSGLECPQSFKTAWHSCSRRAKRVLDI